MDSITSIWHLKTTLGSSMCTIVGSWGNLKIRFFFIKLFIDIVGNEVGLVRHMQHGGDMEKLWITVDHVKHLCDWTMMVCHVYDNKHCKVLTNNIL